MKSQSTESPSDFPVDVVNPVRAYRYDCIVARWHDGDTVVVDIDLGFGVWLHEVAIRLLGINANELNTPAGKEALAYAASLAPPTTRLMLVSYKDRADKYGGRWLGTLFRTGDTVSINAMMLASGHAKPYSGVGPKPV
jgi:endonuclease YncB( thermonuclease family)